MLNWTQIGKSFAMIYFYYWQVKLRYLLLFGKHVENSDEIGWRNVRNSSKEVFASSHYKTIRECAEDRNIRILEEFCLNRNRSQTITFLSRCIASYFSDSETGHKHDQTWPIVELTHFGGSLSCQLQETTYNDFATLEGCILELNQH